MRLNAQMLMLGNGNAVVGDGMVRKVQRDKMGARIVGQDSTLTLELAGDTG
ncbi:MAG: hypothetical protein U0930_12505 [Pirellulales bacterium]